jgi:trehalose 6-phosphate synthase/phosphatase
VTISHLLTGDNIIYMSEKRLFIITNRLPVHYTDSGKSIPSKVGFALSIQTYLDTLEQEEKCNYKEIYWVGIPGCSAESWTRSSYDMPFFKYSFLPVFVNDKMYESYHYKFSNGVIWPLFHYLPSHVDYDNECYKLYLDVNRLFLETVMKYVRKQDVMWINDYHLLPLAGMLRKEFPEITIGLFMRTPFPSYEIIRLLPRKCQEELISGMLGADLIGFNTIDYATHFLQTIRTTHGLQESLNVVRYDNRLIKTDVFPISIPFDKFNNAYDKPEVEEIKIILKEKFKNVKLILSIASLDITKGIYYSLKAYEHFLTRHPEYHEKVVFVLIVPPASEQSQKFRDKKDKIDETISNINSRIGNINWQPVVHYYQSLSFNNALALYTCCDLALVTPLRDGMNLVAKEFVASRRDKKGVLILSELAGAARELTGALITNPNDVEEVSERIKEGLEMTASEQETRITAMRSRICEYDVSMWASDFMNQLTEIKEKQKQFQVKFFNEFTRRSVLHEYQLAKSRLIILDYDGTLVPFQVDPLAAKAENNVLTVLQRLCSETKNDVFLISGRSCDWLDSQFANVSISMVAEYGAKMKLKDKVWTAEIEMTSEWNKQIEETMMKYVKRCPNSFIEVKDFSIVWHFRNASADQGKLRSLELFSELTDHVNGRELQVAMGNKTVEVRRHGMNRDMVIRKMLSGKPYDFILVIGEDKTNEDIFSVLMDDPRASTIKIGEEASYAKYNLLTQRMAISFIENMSSLR